MKPQIEMFEYSALGKSAAVLCRLTDDQMSRRQQRAGANTVFTTRRLHLSNHNRRSPAAHYEFGTGRVVMQAVVEKLLSPKCVCINTHVKLGHQPLLALTNHLELTICKSGPYSV